MTWILSGKTVRWNRIIHQYNSVKMPIHLSMLLFIAFIHKISFCALMSFVRAEVQQTSHHFVVHFCTKWSVIRVAKMQHCIPLLTGSDWYMLATRHTNHLQATHASGHHSQWALLLIIIYNLWNKTPFLQEYWSSFPRTRLKVLNTGPGGTRIFPL